MHWWGFETDTYWVYMQCQYPSAWFREGTRKWGSNQKHVINLMLSNGVSPVDMKYAHMTAIHKGGAAYDLGNCQPISAFPISVKVSKGLATFLRSQKVLAKEQFGSTKNRSAGTVILEVKEVLYNNEQKVHHPLNVSNFFLGALFNENLSWISCVNRLVKDPGCATGSLKRLGHAL